MGNVYNEKKLFRLNQIEKNKTFLLNKKKLESEIPKHYSNIQINDIEGEKWVDMKGGEQYYQISNFGRIKSKETRWRTGQHNFLFIRKGRVLKLHKNKKDYVHAGLAFNTDDATYLVHVLVAKHFIGTIPSGYTVNHLNHIRWDNRASNLQICTQQQNVQDSFDSGSKIQIGNFSRNKKLNESLVKEIRLKFQPRIYTRKKLAMEYKVSEAAIKKVLSGDNWANV